MRITTYKIGNINFMGIELNEVKLINYQIEIVNNNKEIFILPIKERKINDIVKIEVDITDKSNVDSYIKTKRMEYSHYTNIIIRLCDIYEKSEDYLLSTDNIILDNRTIFIDDNTGEVYAIYTPIKKQSLNGDIENLKKYLLELSNNVVVITNKEKIELENIINKLRSNVDSVLELREYTEMSQKRISEKRIIKEEEVVIEKKPSIFNRIINDIFSVNKKDTDKEVRSSNESTIDDEEKKIKKAYLIRDNETVEINKDIFLIGRTANTVDYLINNKIIGRIHARIENIDNEYFLTDLDSKNGTYLNGTRLIANERYKLEDRYEIKIANVILKFIIS